ncbi:MAG TPA: hypothetical protein VHS30_37965 [Streptosporangiaceae bacterium]|nr:hypothetical protein [Streptosporangiaceae bacterium]
MTHGKGWAWAARRGGAATAIGAAALAAVTLLSIQGCAPVPDADADTPASHSVTFADARAAYQTYLKVSDTAAATGDEASALNVVTSAQWAQTRSQYNARIAAGTPVPRYRYGTPAFYVPAQSGFPEWFMVTANRTTVTGGKPGATDHTLMLFAREKATEDWTLSGTAVVSRPLPAIARDLDGYAIPVSTSDSSLLLRPDVVGATQAAVVDDGPSSPAAGVIAAGPLTTGLHAAQTARAAAEQRRGLEYQWLLQGAPYPQVGLRLADSGSALIMYGMYLNTSNEHPNLVAGSPIAVPAEFQPMLAEPTEIGYHAVLANWAYQFAAIDPAATASAGKLEVIGSQRGPSFGHAY